MNENLSEMLKSKTSEPVVFSENDLDLNVEEETEELEVAEEEKPITYAPIKITTLSQWIDPQVEKFPNIKKPKVDIRGVDPTEQLILTIKDKTEEDGSEKRKVVVFSNANEIPVLNMNAVDMQVYNNGFRIIYDLGAGIFVKSYGIKTGIISTFCHDINDQFIPYAIVKSKKSDKELEIPIADSKLAEENLKKRIDIEAFQLRYKQAAKIEFKTNQEAISWLLERQGGVEDINHHLQIDTVIIDTLA